VSHPVVVANNPDRLDLYITGVDDQVYASWWHAVSRLVGNRHPLLTQGI
jgi:hypothetical protein